MAELQENESGDELIEWVRDARAKTCDLVNDLKDDQMMGPKLPIINPLLWEIGHTAYFQEFWVLRHVGGAKPIRPQVDQLYDSIAIDHDLRWDLPMFLRDTVMDYIHEIAQRTVDLLSTTTLSDALRYFVKLSVFHEDMHTEAFSYTRQTLGYPRPGFVRTPAVDSSEISCSGDVSIPGGRWQLGALRTEPFVFDNEKWAHEVEVQPFAISTTAVTQGQFAEFVDDDGYSRRELWSREGWLWREQADASAPLYWQHESSGWSRRVFDQWQPIRSRQAMIHVNWYEAQAYCQWAKRRLPTEAEWEIAASGSNQNGELVVSKPAYPWGNDRAAPQQANLDWQAGDTANVDQFEAGDSAFGCRQMIGNVWEWTDTTFGPFPGFVPDPYDQYSQPCFNQCKVLRGGCWVTRSRLIRNTWRNFYMPDRRDVWCGFRTCALDSDGRGV